MRHVEHTRGAAIDRSRGTASDMGDASRTKTISESAGIFRRAPFITTRQAIFIAVRPERPPSPATPSSVAAHDGIHADALSLKSRFSSKAGCLDSSPCVIMTNPAKKLPVELNFEAAMDRLEAIVDQMESGKMMLEELIVRYEEGMKLVKICQERLTSAEQRIEVITRNHAGKPMVKEFEAKAEPGPSVDLPPKANPPNDEVRLF